LYYQFNVAVRTAKDQNYNYLHFTKVSVNNNVILALL